MYTIKKSIPLLIYIMKNKYVISELFIRIFINNLLYNLFIILYIYLYNIYNFIIILSNNEK